MATQGSATTPGSAQSQPGSGPTDSIQSSPSGAGILLAIPYAKSGDGIPVEIEVEPDERRPFELGDILTREFAARNSSILVSFAFHILMMLLLSLVLIHSTGKAMIMLDLLSSPDVEEYDGVVAEIDLNINDLDQLVAAVDEDPFDSAFGEKDGDETVTDASQVAGSEGGGDKSTGKGDGKSAKFFGMRAIGNKFVYVLDRSGSMAYESPDVADYKVSRFDVARIELMNSVESLRPHQEFYVVLFSTGMEQMFDRNALVPQPVKATPENKARLKYWLRYHNAYGGTDPRGSLKLAFKMNPDAIFMLSDGEFRDERNDGNPLSIDITRKQVEEKSPIRINSIALEDDASKTNMEELSTVTGGQFKFVKVKDYISRMASSPAEFFRSGLTDPSNVTLAVSWSERNELAEKLILHLNSPTLADREAAEKRLHELSYGIFESAIPSVAGDVGPEITTEAIEKWKQAWSQANKQTDLNSSTPAGLFATLATVDNKDFLESVDSLNVRDLSPLDQIAVARSILEYQRSIGRVTDKSKRVLMDFLRELNRESKASFSEENFLKRATVTSTERRLETVLKNRRLRASRLYSKTKDKGLLLEVRVELAKDLMRLYPETRLSRQAAENLNLPVSQLNETE